MKFSAFAIYLSPVVRASLCLQACCIASEQRVKEAGPSIAVEAKVAKTRFVPTERIDVDFRATNTGESLLITGNAKSVYSRTILVVYNGRGDVVPRTRHGERLRRSGGTAIAAPGGLQPGRSLDGTLAVNSIYDMTIPDNYRIVVGIPVVDVKTMKKGTGYAKEIWIRITDMDEAGVAPNDPKAADHPK